MNQEVFNNIVNTFETTKDKTGENLDMHYLLIQKGDDVYRHNFNMRSIPSDIRSISKTVLTLVTGIVMDLSQDGVYPEFNMDTYIYPIIENTVNLRNLENKEILNKIQVKHLLTHTIGFDEVLMMRDDIKDMDPLNYIDYIINTDIPHVPGEYYLYSNAGFYLLSVVLEEFIQEDLMEFIKRNLFSKLEIRNFRWEKYGNYLAGATRLHMLPEDLLKIGQTMMHDGIYQDQKIVSKSWLKQMTTLSTLTLQNDTENATLRRYAYAHGMWLAKEDIYFGHGTDGQTLIMIPEKNTIIITLAHQHDMKAIETIINRIINEYL